jgi:REP element-mobilizing transposase RayT
MTKFDPQSHHRRSIRLKEYDYTTPGAYFITLVSWQRENIFGEILDGRMKLNKFGQIAKGQWEKLPRRFRHIELGEFVILPDHIHGIIVLSAGRKGTVGDVALNYYHIMVQNDHKKMKFIKNLTLTIIYEEDFIAKPPFYPEKR